MIFTMHDIEDMGVKYIHSNTVLILKKNNKFCAFWMSSLLVYFNGRIINKGKMIVFAKLWHILESSSSSYYYSLKSTHSIPICLAWLEYADAAHSINCVAILTFELLHHYANRVLA